MNTMKPRLGRFIFACVVVAVISTLSGYRLAYVKCNARFNTSQKANLFMALLEMEQLRKGESTNVLSMLENRCYSSALEVLNMPRRETTNVVIISALNKLISYRSNYAKAEAEWSPTEQRLVEKLRERTNYTGAHK
jgi:hypothetical protein